MPLDGVNDAGVACGIFMSYQGEGKGTPTDTQTDRPDLTSTTLLRLILDYADSVEDAVALAEQYDLHDSASSCFPLHGGRLHRPQRHPRVGGC